MELLDLFIKKISSRETVYVRNQNKQIEKLIKMAHSKGMKTKDLLKILSVNNATFQSWRRGEGIPISKIKEINSFSLEIIGEPIINESNILIGVKKSHHNIRIPRLNEELCYLVGYLCGDGTLLLNAKRRENRVEFDDICKEFLLEIASIIKNQFNIKNYTFGKDNKHNCYCLRFNSKLLLLFFNKIFEIPIGKKKGKLHIPKIIRESSFVRDFISGFFDAEGHIYYNPQRRYYHIVLAQRDKHFLQEIKEVLYNSFNISATLCKNDRLLITNKQNFIKFISQFNLRHPDKLSRIKLALDRKSTAKTIRLSQIKFKILEELEHVNTTRELSQKLNRTRRTIYYHLRELERLGKIKGKRIGSRLEVIWKK